MQRRLFIRNIGGAAIGSAAVTPGSIAASAKRDAEEAGYTVVLRKGDTLIIAVNPSIDIANWDEASARVREVLRWPDTILVQGLDGVVAIRREGDTG